MKRLTVLVLAALLPVMGTGCSMCCGPYDYDYPTFGGKHERVDPSYGRVGSIFSDPLAGGVGPGADSNLQPPPEIESMDDPGLEEISPIQRSMEESDQLPTLEDVQT